MDEILNRVQWMAALLEILSQRPCGNLFDVRFLVEIDKASSKTRNQAAEYELGNMILCFLANIIDFF